MTCLAGERGEEKEDSTQATYCGIIKENRPALRCNYNLSAVA